MRPGKKTAILSSSLAVTVDRKTIDFNASEIAALPQTTVTVTNSHTQRPETYTGARLSDLLAKAGAVGPPHDKAMLRSYVCAEGTDHYLVVYSEGEVQPAAHAGEVIVALKRDGEGLGDDGQFKLVSTEDKKPARWVRNLASVRLSVVE